VSTLEAERNNRVGTPVSHTSDLFIFHPRVSLPPSLDSHSPFNSFSAYFDYGAVTSPLQTSQEIASASSRQPGSRTAVSFP